MPLVADRTEDSLSVGLIRIVDDEDVGDVVFHRLSASPHLGHTSQAKKAAAVGGPEMERGPELARTRLEFVCHPQRHNSLPLHPELL